MTMKLTHALQNQRDHAEVMLEQLKVEEKKCKEMLDLKIDVEQNLEIKQEDAKDKKANREVNRENIIKQQLRLSQLKSQRKRLTAEQEELTTNNAQLVKENEKYEIDNERLNREIVEVIQRIDVATLLKEIDMEEMRHLANQNIQTN